MGSAQAQIGPVRDQLGSAEAQTGQALAQMGSVQDHPGPIQAQVGSVSVQRKQPLVQEARQKLRKLNEALGASRKEAAVLVVRQCLAYNCDCQKKVELVKVEMETGTSGGMEVGASGEME